MAAERICKKCLLLQSGREDTYRQVREYIGKISQRERTDDELYARRLAECEKCEMLNDGICRKCGCYVELRAAYRAQKCPDVRTRRWNF